MAGEIQLEDESLLGRRSTGERGKWRSEQRINTSKNIIMDKSIQFKSNENSSTMEMKNFMKVSSMVRNFNTTLNLENSGGLVFYFCLSTCIIISVHYGIRNRPSEFNQKSLLLVFHFFKLDKSFPDKTLAKVLSECFKEEIIRVSESDGVQERVAVKLSVLLPVEVGPLELISSYVLRRDEGDSLEDGEDCKDGDEHEEEPHHQEDLARVNIS